MTRLCLRLAAFALALGVALPALAQNINQGIRPVTGSATTTGGTATTIIPAQGAKLEMWIYSVQCFRSDSGTTLAYVTLSDTAATVVPLPPTGGAAPPFIAPIVVAANTALTFTSSSSLNAVFCNAQGYKVGAL